MCNFKFHERIEATFLYTTYLAVFLKETFLSVGKFSNEFSSQQKINHVARILKSIKFNVSDPHKKQFCVETIEAILTI